MRRLILALPVFVMMPMAAGAPALKAPVPYLPTTVGSTWSYQYRGYAQDPTGRELVNKVTAIKKWNGMRLVSVAQLGEDGKFGHAFLTAESDNGLWDGYSTGEGFAPGRLTLKLPHVAGNEWREYRDGMNKPPRPEWFTARRTERIRVPAGIFEAERVDQICEERTDGKQGLRTSWYVRGIGLVKWENSDGASMVLNKFTSGAK